jgi:hypothetical protein
MPAGGGLEEPAGAFFKNVRPHPKLLDEAMRDLIVSIIELFALSSFVTGIVMWSEWFAK